MKALSVRITLGDLAHDDDEAMSAVLLLRITPTDVRRLARLLRGKGSASRNAIARAAMRVGLKVLEQSRPALSAVQQPRRGRKPYSTKKKHRPVSKTGRSA